MTNEFKKINQGNITRYVLENASGGGTSSGSVASVSMPMGGMQRRKGDNLIAQESDKKKVPATTPRNFVAKNAKSSGAGAHKDKKKAAKQGQEKHKKPFMEDHSTATGGWGQGSYDTYSGGNHGRGVAENPEWYRDEANGMSSSQLKSLYKHAMKLRQAVQQMQAQGDTLEPWQQSKVTKAADYLDAVFNAVDDEHDMGESNHPDEKEDKALIRKMVKQQALKQERLTKEGEEGDAGVIHKFKGLYQSLISKVSQIPNFKQYYNAAKTKQKEAVNAIRTSKNKEELKQKIAQIAGSIQVTEAKPMSKLDIDDQEHQAGLSIAAPALGAAGATAAGLWDIWAAQVLGVYSTAASYFAAGETGMGLAGGVLFGVLGQLGCLGIAIYLATTAAKRYSAKKAVDNRTQQGANENFINQSSQAVTSEEEEVDAGLSKDAETNFHAKLDQLVHATFGKRKEEQGVAEGLESEGSTFKNSLHTIIRVATHLEKQMGDNENFPEWESEMIGSVKDQMVKIMNYEISKKEQGVAEGSLNELSKDTLKSYSNERGATIHADQRDAGGARTMAADKKKHGDTTASADWDDEASWLDKRAEKGAKGVAQATTKIAKKGVAEDTYFESLQQMVERQLEPTMDLDAWVDNFQNADPNKYHQFKNKTPEKKK